MPKDSEGGSVLDLGKLPEAAETLLGTVVLGPPILLSVQVDPPRHPGGGGWTLALRAVGARPGEPAVEITDGRFHLTGLDAGSYLVHAGGNGGAASVLHPVQLRDRSRR